PDWLDEALENFDDCESLLAALLAPAPLDIRVNPKKADRDTLLAELQSLDAKSLDSLRIEGTPWSPWGVRIHGRPALNRWSRYLDGTLEVQDEGSQLLALLVAPRRGEMIID